MNHNHAEDIANEHATGTARTQATRTTQEKAAARIAGILAHAEDAAKRGDEAERDRLLEMASGLQLKYAVDETMLRKDTGEGAEEIGHLDFCQEHGPLIKAKRILVNQVALFARGKAVIMGEYTTQTTGKNKGRTKYDARAKVRVYACASDLAFIRTLYTSLITQMQTMMAADERAEALRAFRGASPQSWRVSYAHGWVSRVALRMQEIKARQEREATTSEPGTALVLRDRTALVNDHFAQAHPKAKTANYRIDANDRNGRSAGYAAGARADLGQQRVGAQHTRQLGT